MREKQAIKQFDFYKINPIEQPKEIYFYKEKSILKTKKGIISSIVLPCISVVIFGLTGNFLYKNITSTNRITDIMKSENIRIENNIQKFSSENKHNKFVVNNYKQCLYSGRRIIDPEVIDLQCKMYVLQLTEVQDEVKIEKKEVYEIFNKLSEISKYSLQSQKEIDEIITKLDIMPKVK